jgi:TetR/AcrR family transcriptional regulator, transcriptional repressor of aconitase
VSELETRRRRQILAAVAQCVAEEGIGRATMRRIAERAGVSTGMITYYYANKEELLKGTVQAALEHMAERIAQRIGEAAGIERLAAIFDVSLASRDSITPSWSFTVEYWARATQDEELRLYHAERYCVVRESLARSFRAGIESGLLRRDLDPGLVADMALGLLHGLGLHRALEPDLVTSDRAQAISQAFIALLADPGGSGLSRRDAAVSSKDGAAARQLRSR